MGAAEIMIDIRPFARLGHADHGWLDTRHHFSFAQYHDPDRMGWGALRVWNDDVIAAKTGFPPHSHRDMEIITYVLEGAISHKDSLGNEGRTQAGEVQVMSAGSGITHSEFNLEGKPTHIFQLWIMPREAGGPPCWNSQNFAKDTADWQVLASGFSDDEKALPLRADARVLGVDLKQGEPVTYAMKQGRTAYLVPATGSMTVNGQQAERRDGIAIVDEQSIEIVPLSDGKAVLVETA